MLKCIFFSNPYINLLALLSITHEYKPKVLEHLYQLQCVATHLQNL